MWAGTWNNAVRVAVKTMKEGTMDADKFLEEANVMKRLKHPHVLQLKAICSREVNLRVDKTNARFYALITLKYSYPIKISRHNELSTSKF